MIDREPPADPLVPVSFGDWFTKGTAVARRNLVPLVVIQLAVFVPVAVLVGLLGGLDVLRDVESIGSAFGFGYALPAGSVAVRVLAVVLGTLGLAASVFVIVRDAAGLPWTAPEVLRFAGRRFLPLLGWTLLSVIVTAIGFVLLIVPGIYLLVVFSGALLGVVTIERGGFGRSFSLVNPRFFGVLGRLLVLLLISVVYQGIALAIGSLPALGRTPGDPLIIVSQLLINLLTIPLSAYLIAMAVVLYGELRASREPGVTTATFAAEIDRRRSG